MVTNEDELKELKFNISGSSCVEVDFENHQFYQKSNQAFDLSKLNGSSDLSHAPLHLSVFGYNAKNCAQPHTYNAKDMLAVFISQKDEQSMDRHSSINKNDNVCVINKKTLNLSDPVNQKFEYTGLGSNCHIERPHFVYHQKFIDYVGTLNSWANQGNINIEIPLGTTVNMPLTTEYVRLPVPSSLANPKACSDAIDHFNSQPYQASTSANNLRDAIYDACGLKYVEDTNNSTLENASKVDQINKFPVLKGAYRNYTFSQKNPHSIKIHGFGRIDGAGIPSYGKDVDAYRPMSWQGSIWNNGIMDTGQGNILQYAQYRIESSLLGLDSEAQVKGNASSIDVSGITVANGLRRNRGAIQLNVAQFGPLKNEQNPADPTNEDRRGDNTPTSMFDVKQVGFYIDAVDGADVGSDGSTQTYMYSQIADDTVKVEAENQLVDHYTVIHGNSGSVVMPGMYGVLRDSLKNSVIQNIYIHRDMSVRPLDNPKYDENNFAKNKWGTFGGLIATKDCLRYPTQFSLSDYGKGGITDISFGGFSVQNLYLLSHGQEDGTTLSNFSKLFTLNAGTVKNMYCSDNFDSNSFYSNTNQPNLTVLVDPITIKNIKIDVVPKNDKTTDYSRIILRNFDDGNPKNIQYKATPELIKAKRVFIGCDVSSSNAESCFAGSKDPNDINGGIKIKQNNHTNDYDYLSFVWDDKKAEFWSTKGKGTHSDNVLGYVKDDISNSDFTDIYLLPYGQLPNN
ncbi:hypothetical protein CF386_08980 [Paraphotobacterium marinum]|uniref:Uncharacterized protein n=1 Tax=Paraphotobacterium marinum TaxID=1755811 RepID=A0A220VFN8_9GAMM|nr:hypothetical protein [Paraphotobacterium marinum]ASK79194.1 hypothetical protein CF386_08980 [Paraphotobacterium marinum]